MEQEQVVDIAEQKKVRLDKLAEMVAAVATRGVVSDGRKAVIPGDRT